MTKCVRHEKRNGRGTKLTGFVLETEKCFTPGV